MMSLVLGVCVALGMLLLVPYVGKKFLARSGARAKDRAIALGLEVAEVERELPISTNRGRSYRLEGGPCTEYLLPSRDYPLRWKLLQRPDGASRRGSAGWVTESSKELPGKTRTVLEGIMKDWTEEFLELEGTARGVAAYWEEWGGAEEAERVHKYLADLLSAAGSAPTTSER